MGYIEKRGKRHRAQVRMRGVDVSRTFRTAREAEYWVADTERKILAGMGVAVVGHTVADMLERFSREECPKRAKCRWEQNRLAALAQDPLGRRKLADFTAEAVDEWQKRRLEEVSGATVRRDRALLSVVVRRAVRIWKWLPASPLPDVPLPPDNPGRTRIVTDDEIERLWHVAGRDLQTIQARAIAAFVFAVETGMRGAEIAALTRADAPAGRAWVHIRKSKNGDERDVPLSPRAAALLDQVRALDMVPTLWGMTMAQKDALFRRVRDKAGIEGLTFHDSRATAITRLAQKLDILALARMIGHRDLASLQVYYRESAEELAKRLQ